MDSREKPLASLQVLLAKIEAGEDLDAVAEAMKESLMSLSVHNAVTPSEEGRRLFDEGLVLMDRLKRLGDEERRRGDKGMPGWGCVIALVIYAGLAVLVLWLGR